MILAGYVLLGCIIVIVELIRQRHTYYDFLLFFNFYFMMVYVVTPIFLISDVDLYAHSLLTYGLVYFGKPLTPWLIIVSYCVLLTGYYWRLPGNVAKRFRIDVVASGGLVLMFTAMGMVFLYACIYFYTKQFGGLKNAIIMAELIRSGIIEGGAFEFLKQFLSISVIGLFFTFIKTFHNGSHKYKRAYAALFLLFCVSFFIIAMLKNSRGYFIITLGGFYFILATLKQKLYLKWLVVVVAAAILFILAGDPFFTSVQFYFTEGFHSFYSHFSGAMATMQNEKLINLIQEFSHPIISLEISLELSGYEIAFRLLRDYYYALISLAPDRLLGITVPKTISYLNTLLNHGTYEPRVPPGLLGLFSYSGSYVGMVIGMFCYGMAGRFLSTLAAPDKDAAPSKVVFYYLLAFSYGSFVFSGEPRSALISNFSLLSTLAIIILFLSKVKYKKASRKAAENKVA